MCGRYASFREDQQLADEFAIATVADEVGLLGPSWNVAPTDGVRVVVDWPDRYLNKVGAELTPRDAVCVLTHDHKFDVPAITAALCAGPDAHIRPERRYISAVVAGLFYAAIFSLLSAIAAGLVTASSPILIEAAAGLALVSAFGASLLGAVQEESQRLPALATFLVTASGFSLYGIGAAFWGLCAGLVVHMLYSGANRGTTKAKKSAT